MVNTLKNHNESNHRLLVIVILTSLMLIISFYKVGRYAANPYFNLIDDDSLFTSEGAFQYRYASMVAAGGSIPDLDIDAQWPEGIEPWRELSLVMEPIHGELYRLLGFSDSSLSFHIFVIYFISFFTSLPLLLVYLLCRMHGSSEFQGLYCATFYTFTTATYSRISGYELEYFAFPFLLAGCWSLSKILKLECQRTSVFHDEDINSRPEETQLPNTFFHELKNVLPLVMGTIFFFTIALMSWHFSRFALLIITIGFILADITVKKQPSHVTYYGPLSIVISCIFAFIFSPVMRNTGLLVSPLFFISVFTSVSVFYFSRHSVSISKKISLYGFGMLLSLFALWISSSELHEYGHVWYLLIEKIRFYGIKPSVPGVLHEEARVLWNGPFNTTSLFTLHYQLRLMLYLGFISSIIYYRRFRFRELYSSWFTFVFILFAGAGLFIQRLLIFPVFFAAITLFVLFPATLPKKKPRTGKLRAATFVLSIFLLFQISEAVLWERTFYTHLIARIFTDGKTIRPYLEPADKLQFMEWIRNNTSPGDSILTNYELSPSILTYCKRPIVLHPKFESSLMRQRVLEFSKALFSNCEDDLIHFMERQKCSFLVLPINTFYEHDGDSYRFIAGLTTVNPSHLIFRLQFRPETLKQLELIFRNGFYQIFKRKSEGLCEFGIIPKLYHPLYYESTFNRGPLVESELWNDAKADRILENYNFTKDLRKRLEKISGKEKATEALRLIEKYKNRLVPDVSFQRIYATLFLQVENFDKANETLDQAIRWAPQNPDLLKLKQKFLIIQGKQNEALYYEELIQNFSKK